MWNAFYNFLLGKHMNQMVTEYVLWPFYNFILKF